MPVDRERISDLCARAHRTMRRVDGLYTAAQSHYRKAERARREATRRRQRASEAGSDPRAPGGTGV